MSTRDLIRSEIDRVPEERLAELYELVRRFGQAAGGPSLMAKLRAVRIDAPADFAERFEEYTNGEGRDADVP